LQCLFRQVVHQDEQATHGDDRAEHQGEEQHRLVHGDTVP
jgi:hypothetical protein